jgi:hypothetical protein
VVRIITNERGLRMHPYDLDLTSPSEQGKLITKVMDY